MKKLFMMVIAALCVRLTAMTLAVETQQLAFGDIFYK